MQVYDMKGVQRARFCHNRKDPEDTYLPGEDALYRLRDGRPRNARLDLSNWGVCDDDMPGIAVVSESSWKVDGQRRPRLRSPMLNSNL